jgi:hypothetical protein
LQQFSLKRGKVVIIGEQLCYTRHREFCTEAPLFYLGEAVVEIVDSAGPTT